MLLISFSINIMQHNEMGHLKIYVCCTVRIGISCTYGVLAVRFRKQQQLQYLTGKFYCTIL